MIQVPYHLIEKQLLYHMLEEFVTRDGTELSSTEEKIQEVEKGLSLGIFVVVFDEIEECCTIVKREKWKDFLLRSKECDMSKE